jgi:hypothetical protein
MQMIHVFVDDFESFLLNYKRLRGRIPIQSLSLHDTLHQRVFLPQKALKNK